MEKGLELAARRPIRCSGHAVASARQRATLAMPERYRIPLFVSSGEPGYLEDAEDTAPLLPGLSAG